jgi:ABC-type lipoprotein release transport system permease subunit
MNLPFLFARRYLLAKRSTNAINVITAISIGVIAVVTAAMVVVLSTLNGIADLVDSIYSPFDQDITITAAEGKTFGKDAVDLERILAMPTVQNSSWVIEENVLLRSGDQQTVATMKGVESQYLSMSHMARYLFSGEPTFEGLAGPAAILGIGLKTELGVPLDDGIFEPLEISAPVRGRKLSKYQQRAFETTAIAVRGTYTMNMEFDMKYALVPLDIAADLLHYDSAVTALELQLVDKKDMDRTAETLRAQLGNSFTVKTRYQKNALMYSTNASRSSSPSSSSPSSASSVAFNIIASLTMMMIEKRRDMRTLMGMGATPSTVRGIFFGEGVLIVVVGTVVGLAGARYLLGTTTLRHRAAQRLGGGSVSREGAALDLVLIARSGADHRSAGFTAGPLRTLSRRFLHAASPKA